MCEAENVVFVKKKLCALVIKTLLEEMVHRFNKHINDIDHISGPGVSRKHEYVNINYGYGMKKSSVSGLFLKITFVLIREMNRR